MQVEEGSVKVNGESVGEIISSSGSVVVMITPKMAPALRLVTVGNDAVGVNFAWRRANWSADDRVRIEIASDRGFTKVSQRIFPEEDNTVVHLTPGMWFWRVLAVPKDRDEPTSLSLNNAASGYITITQAPAPEAVAPRQDEEFAYRNQVPAVRFQWNAAQSLLGMTNQFLVEVSASPSMANPVLASTVDGTFLLATTLPAGTWFWRVTPVFPKSIEAPPLHSQVRSFSISQTRTVSPPVVQIPEDRAIVALESGTGDIRFAWKSEAEAASYTLRIADNPGMNSPLVTRQVTTNYYVYHIADGPLRDRSYYWTVSQTDKTGEVSQPSRARQMTFTAATAIIPLYPPDEYTVMEDALSRLKFSWRSSGGGGEVRFQLSSSADFSTFTTNEVVQGNDFRVSTLAPGSHYWRIQEITSTSQTVFSPTRTLMVTPPSVLFPAPGGRRPENNYRLGVRDLQRSREIVFSWNAVTGANRYILTIYATDSGRRQQIVQTEPLAALTYTLTNLSQLPGRNFVWSVEAVFSDGNGTNFVQRGTLGENTFVLDIPVPKVVINEPGKLYGE
jgi:hypothetical protein